MSENIEKILAREEKVELLVRRANKTDKFAQDIKDNVWCEIDLGLPHQAEGVL